MKTIAMYLPQFHKVPENDEWWGKGFTDWRAMASAKPLFAGHKQPKAPLGNYQYDLLDKGTLQWQEGLMKSYHVYGLCFYHYWFKNGRRILEKPAENLLRWKDIDIPFCFSWANESWGRSWSNVGNQNVWASAFETPGEHIGNGTLLEQDYGSREDWESHFNYFLPFFEDGRYIKKDGRPIVLIYLPGDMHCLKEMREAWDELAVLHGFPGVYIIGNYCDGKERDFIDAALVAEPSMTINRAFPARYADKDRMEVARCLPYEEVCRESLKWTAPSDMKMYYGGFSNYDDTPRRGNAGSVIYNDTPEKFKVYLTDLYAKNAACGNEFVFVNAWNEWGEGMHLEPDEEYGSGFLEAVPYAEKHYPEEMYKYAHKDEGCKTDVGQMQASRYSQEVSVLDNWMLLLERRLEIAQWLARHGYRRVGIYGLGVLGRHLLTQLGRHQLGYLCCIDRNAKGLNLDVPVFLPDEIPGLDLLVITNVHIYSEICGGLGGVDCEMISLELLVKNVLNEA